MSVRIQTLWLSILLLGLSSCNLDFHYTKLPTIVEEVFWCGADGRTVIILTEEKHVFKSDDEGNSWHPIHSRIQKHGRRVAGSNEEVGDVNWISVSPLDQNIIMFFGDRGVVWVSQDCGNTIRALYQGRSINKYIFHPTESQWGLASSFTECSEEEIERKKCKFRRQLFFTNTLGNSWQKITEHVLQFGWGFLDDQHLKLGIPKERVLAIVENHPSGHQDFSSAKYDLLQSDNFFSTAPKRLVRHGSHFSLSEDFLYVSQLKNPRTSETQLLVAHRKSNFQHFEKARLPFQHLKGHSFTIVDTSEGAAMIHVDHFGPQHNVGNLYISDATGVSFSLSLAMNTRENGVCDVERIWGLEGIYYANVVELDNEELWEDELEDFDNMSQEDEIMTTKSSSASQAREQAQAKMHNKDYARFETNRLAQQKKTYVTFNKGGKWQVVTPPDADSHGKSIRCRSSLGCSLHFHAASTQEKIAPLYSFASSPGLIISNGNIGPYLDANPAVTNTYLSRDGGKTWMEIAKGPHVYEFGNYGSLIVMAPDMRNTTHIMYSWDQGLTWDFEVISNEPVIVENIMIEPSASSQKFIVIGFKQSDSVEGFVVHLDFTPLHERACQGVWSTSQSSSDFERWSPYDGRHGAQCLLGRHIYYTRRKRNSKCFIDSELPRPFITNCECTDYDYECDEGYARQTQNSPCVLQQSIPQIKGQFLKEKQTDNYDPSVQKQKECAETGYWFATQGYRKVAGNTCYGGVDRNPKRHSCSTLRGAASGLLWLVIVLLICAFVFVYCKVPLSRFGDVKERLLQWWKKLKEQVGGNDARQGSGDYERVGFASVPDHYEPDDEEEEEDPVIIKKTEEEQEPEKKEEPTEEKSHPLEL